MQHPVRGSVQFYANEIVALKIKHAEDAKKVKEANKEAKNQAEAHKEQIKQLEENFKKQTAAIKAQIRTAKTKHRQAQEEIVVKQEQHRTTLAAVTQDNADFYEDEVAQLNASLEVADLETKIMVDGKATREWDIDYWLGQMKSMMHTTPAVTLKLWDYAMNYVEATSAVKRSKNWSPPTRKHLAELRTDAGLVGQICAGVAVAKAKTLLTVMIDETELECSSMQSMITTIEDESGRVRSIALDGVTLLKKKTSEAAAEATSDTFRSTSIILSHVRAAYVHALKNRTLPGMDEKDWHNLLYVPRKKGKGKDKGARVMNLKEIKALATEQFGDTTKIDESRVQASASDHCNGAQDALRRFAVIAKTEAKLKQQYGSEWDSMDVAERNKASAW